MFVALHTSTQHAERRRRFFPLNAFTLEGYTKIYFGKYCILKNLLSLLRSSSKFSNPQNALVLCEKCLWWKGLFMQRHSGRGRRIHCNFALHQLSTLFQKFARAQWWKEGKTIKKWSLSSLLWFTSTCRSRNFFFSTCLWTRAAANLMYMVGIFIPL